MGLWGSRGQESEDRSRGQSVEGGEKAEVRRGPVVPVLACYGESRLKAPKPPCRASHRQGSEFFRQVTSAVRTCRRRRRWRRPA